MNSELIFGYGAGAATTMVPIHDGGHILAIYTDFMKLFSEPKAQTLLLHWSSDHAVDLVLSYNLPYGWITIEQS